MDVRFSLILCIVLVTYKYLDIKAAYLYWKLTLNGKLNISEQRRLVTY
jgi:hypothetical protein